jgi:hypothetical protein
MDADRSSGDVLARMLIDLLSEADTVRWHDPARAAYLDEAANDLRAVIAEKNETSQHTSD